MTYQNFEKHISKLTQDIYNEPSSSQHTNASKELIEEFCKDLIFDSVVEFGCGTAPILDEMKKMGKKTLGITLGGEVVDHEVLREDMHFTTVADSSFDMVVARHVLEHSYMPLILLMEMRRVATRHALVVVPVPDERMIEWRNHYSALPKENWEWLFKLSRWEVLKFKEAVLLQEEHYTYKEYRYLLKAV
jgi:2-polyprenyl-3-methyl-5-hydroxy-6-metoxy-1,4-benzoquinol methylase